MQERVFRDGVLIDTIEHPDPLTLPLIFKDSEFFAYCWSKLGGGDVGMARFQDIQDSAFDAGGAAKSASRQIDRLTAFSKDEAAVLLAAIQSAGSMQQAELDTILNDWPTT